MELGRGIDKLGALRLVFLLLLGLEGLASVQAETFVVTKETDDDGPCTAADCALREAVLAANALPGLDSIEVPAGTYQLSLVGPVEENFSMTGDLDIVGDLELRGDPVGSTTVVGDGTDRVLQVLGGANVEIFRLVLTGGAAQASGGGLRFSRNTFGAEGVRHPREHRCGR